MSSDLTVTVRDNLCQENNLPKAMDTILGHCILRALVHEAGGADAANAKYASMASLAKWDAVRTAVKVTPKASRVATFIVLWAVAMRIEGLDEFSITEYQRYWNEGERQAYRVQREFRELWPEYETPDELARAISRHIDKRISKKDAAKLPMTLRVSAELR
jgi:hypothetical protein